MRMRFKHELLTSGQPIGVEKQQLLLRGGFVLVSMEGVDVNRGAKFNVRSNVAV